MNEETSIPTETWDCLSDQPAAMEVEASDPSVVPEALIPVETEMSLADWFTEPTEATSGSETLPYYALEETVSETVAPVSADLLESATSTIVHADLFGSFLICGTLIGLFIFRGRYGN